MVEPLNNEHLMPTRPNNCKHTEVTVTSIRDVSQQLANVSEGTMSYYRAYTYQVELTCSLCKEKLFGVVQPRTI